MTDTERMTFPPGQRRHDDREWFSVVRQYDGVILIVIAVVIILGGVVTWMDRRDATAMFAKMGDAISELTAEARGMKVTLTRVETSVDLLSEQNSRWISVARELEQAKEKLKTLQTDLRVLMQRTQRIEDQRAIEREMQGRPP